MNAPLSSFPFRRFPLGCALALSLFLAACGRPSTAPPETAAPAAADPSGSIRVDPAMVSSLHTGVVALQTVPRAIRASGKVQFDDSRIARVLAPVAGQVGGLTVGVGAHIQKGDVLFSLRSRDASSAVEDYFDAQRDLELSQKTMTMTQDLFEHQGASRIALEQAQNDLAKAKARIDRTSAALVSLGLRPNESGAIDGRIPVTSPINGTVIERHVSDGQFVQPDPNPLLLIADLTSVWVEADIFERDIHLLREGQPADVTTSAYPDEKFRARIAHVSDVLDPATRTVKVRFEVSNANLKLKPEMFATTTLFVEEREQALIVPAAAVLTEGDRTFVYVATGDHLYARRWVEVAADTADTRRVLRGLSPGDRIVTGGAVLVRGLEDRGSN